VIDTSTVQPLTFKRAAKIVAIVLAAIIAAPLVAAWLIYRLNEGKR
jgi:hypothetical protein